MWGSVIAGALIALPLACVVARQWARHRAARGRPRPAATAWADVLMVVGTAPWLWMILTPTGGPGGVDLMPLHDLAGVLDGPPGTAIVQVGGNLLAFAAIGALLPVRSARLAGFAAVALVAAAASTGVEVLQFALRLGRVSAVDDVLLNTAGALLAAALSRRWWARPIAAGVVR